MTFERYRRAYHETICRDVIGCLEGVPDIADGTDATSIQVARAMLARIGLPLCSEPPAQQTARKLFSSLTRDYLRQVFDRIYRPRPVQWIFAVDGEGVIFDGYEDLSELAQLLTENPDAAKAFGEYVLLPDILIGRTLVSELQATESDDASQGESDDARSVGARSAPDLKPILRAGISCNWKLGTNGAHHPPTEALNLIRNRKGHVPHIAVVTAEPLPMRIASIALGTGDLDCVYHFALPEMQAAIEEIDNQDQKDMLETLIQGRRLRDISDLPFDLAT
jgi:hypothetical protein